MKHNIPINYIESKEEVKSDIKIDYEDKLENKINKLEKAIEFIIKYWKYIGYTILAIILILISIDLINKYSNYKIEISNLDKSKQEFIKSKEKELGEINAKIVPLQRDKEKLVSCIYGVKKTLGTKEYYNCEPKIIIPNTNAEEAEEVKEETLLTPNELFYTTKVTDKCHISQNEQSHFTKAGGYMLATDVACDFNKDGKGDQFEVYAPDYLDKNTTYLLKIKKDDLLGDYIELLFDSENKDKNLEALPLINTKWIIGHITTAFKDGDIVQTGQRIGQSNLTGVTTGYHNHIELWQIIDGKWKNISYTTRSQVLDNKRNNVLQTWKNGDTFYFTHYDLGDVRQNDKSPNIGASGKDLSDLSIENPIALTVDVRNSLGIKFGDKVKLISSDGKEYIATVHDEMNQRFRYSCIKKNGYCIKGDIAYRNGKGIPSGIYKIIK